MPQPLLIEGHASLFGLADLAGDVVHRGAFARTLRAKTSIPMLFQHDPAEPVVPLKTVNPRIGVDLFALDLALEGQAAQSRAGFVPALFPSFRSIDSCQPYAEISVGQRTAAAQGIPIDRHSQRADEGEANHRAKGSKSS